MLSLRQRSPGGAVSRIRPNWGFFFVVRADVQLWEDALHYSFLLWSLCNWATKVCVQPYSFSWANLWGKAALWEQPGLRNKFTEKMLPMLPSVMYSYNCTKEIWSWWTCTSLSKCNIWHTFIFQNRDLEYFLYFNQELDDLLSMWNIILDWSSWVFLSI